jgi:membrane protein DedA with SNARE-associated domain
LNLVAGGSGYRFGRFLAFDVAGEAVWVCLFTGLGYLFAGSPEALSAMPGSLSWWLLAAAVLALGAYGVYWLLPRRRAA